MVEESIETIVRLPDTQLHEVYNGVQSLKEWGPLLVTIHSFHGESGLWLQVGKTQFSVDATTPTLESTPNSYMFAMTNGRFLSLLLAQGSPAEEAATLREILVECTLFEHAGGMTKQHTDDLVNQLAHDVENDPDIPLAVAQQPGVASTAAAPTTASRILSGAATAQDKLLQSANWASRKILEQSQAYMDKHEATQNPINISPAVAKRVKMARKAAEMSNRAANRVAGGIADISVRMADSIIHHLGPSHYGEQLQDPKARPNAAKEIAAAAVVAASGIYDSMEQASRLVLKSGGQATSEFVGHKYGTQAGEVANDAAHAAVTGGMTMLSVEKVGLRKIAQRIAKRTAKGLAKNAFLGSKPQTGSQQQGSLAQGGQQQILGSQAQSRPMQVSQAAPQYGSAVLESSTASYKSPFAN